MRLTRILSLLGMAVLCTGCIQTFIHPLFTEEDLIFDPTLIGTWRGEKDDEVEITIQRRPLEKAYTVVMNADLKKPVQLIGSLGKIGKYTFLDLGPDGGIEEDYAFYFLPVHHLSRVWIEEGSLRTAAIDEWFESVTSHPDSTIRFEEDGLNRIVTSSTRELVKS